VRLAFAVIAHADADILVIDEALSVGDVFFAQKCMRFLHAFQKHGTVLFVSHSAAAVTGLCDRAIWLDAGRMVIDGPAKDVCEAYHASLYGQSVQTRIERLSAAVAAADAGDRADRGAQPIDDDDGHDHCQVRVFAFDPDRAGFGDGRASIRGAWFADADGRALVQVSGGELVRLQVEVEAREALDSPIVGFFLKDRFGQQLFGKNTWREEAPPRAVPAGGSVRATFEFRMPYLRRGAYTVDVAVADGSHHAHVQAAWVFDALALESVSSTVATGLVGIPFRSVTLDPG
jgi:lipopolysaccharide transport system ATP-binding protein